MTFCMCGFADQCLLMLKVHFTSSKTTTGQQYNIFNLLQTYFHRRTLLSVPLANHQSTFSAGEKRKKPLEGDETSNFTCLFPLFTRHLIRLEAHHRFLFEISYFKLMQHVNLVLNTNGHLRACNS